MDVQGTSMTADAYAVIGLVMFIIVCFGFAWLDK